jgi:hypothetical protein
MLEDSVDAIASEEIVINNYVFKINIFCDGKYFMKFLYTSAIDAVKAFDGFSELHDAKEYCKYTLEEPNGKETSKVYYRNGKYAKK